MDLSQETRAAINESESRERVKDAANRILELSSQLHLTWHELECAFDRVKRFGKVC